MKHTPKPVIMIIIDTLMTTPLEEAVQTGYAPALHFFMENGRYIPHVVSSFPTMSVNIESTLLTGTYADQHRVPALIWYDEERKRIVNCGTGIKEVIASGFSQFLEDMYVRLNNNYLSKQVKTIHEELAEQGLTSGSINAFVYRGHIVRLVDVPRRLQIMSETESPWAVHTPNTWSLGSFAKVRPFTFTPQTFSGNYKAGFQELKYLLKEKQLPDFMMCGIQDLDLRIHLKGPMDLHGIHKIDRELQHVLNLYPSWEHALEACTWILLSDNGHASMGHKRSHYVIDLRKLLHGFSIIDKGRTKDQNEQLALAVNQRTAFIYSLKHESDKKSVIHRLKKDHRIDIIAWKENGTIQVASGEKEGQFSFSAGSGWVDKYHQYWSIAGDEKLLDLTIKHGVIHYGAYPDGLARLSSSLHSHKGNYLVVTAKPGYEFKDKASPTHLGGAAHGSLHKQESLVPMIVAGTETLPSSDRLVDFKPWLMELLLGKEE